MDTLKINCMGCGESYDCVTGDEECPNCTSSASPACSIAPFTKDAAAALALDIAEKWWNEGKISYNWDATKDVAWLAQAIYEGKLPEAQ